MALASGDVLVYDGSSWINTGQTKVVLGSDPAAAANNGLLNLGGGGFAGGGTNFAGSAQGTVLAANVGSSFTGNLVDLQVAGSSRAAISSVGALTETLVDGNNSANTYGLHLQHVPTGTAGAGLGTGIRFVLKDDGGGTPEAGSIQCVYSSAAAASRSSYLSFNTYYGGTAVEILRLRAAGTTGQGEARFNGDLWHSQSGGKIGFFGVTTVARAAAYTQTYSTTTRTNPNFSGQDNAQAGSVYAKFADLQTLQQLVNAIIDDLQAYGLLQ